MYYSLGMGRTKLEPGRARTRTLQVRVTPVEYAKFRSACISRGMSEADAHREALHLWVLSDRS